MSSHEIEDRLIALREGIVALVRALDELGLEEKNLPAGALQRLAEAAADVDGVLASVLQKATRERVNRAAETAARVEREMEKLGDELEPLIARELPPFAGEEGVTLVQLGGAKRDPELDAAYSEYLAAHAKAGMPDAAMDRLAFDAAHAELARLIDAENEGTIDREGLQRRAALEDELWPG